MDASGLAAAARRARLLELITLNLTAVRQKRIKANLDTLDDAAIEELTGFIGENETKRRVMFDVLSHDSIEPYVRWRGWYESYFDAFETVSGFNSTTRTVSLIASLESYPQAHGNPDMEWALLYATIRLFNAENRHVNRALKELIVERSPDWTPKIKDDELVALLCSRPKDAERIVELLIAKPTYRAAELELILSDHGHTPPLIEGAL